MRESFVFYKSFYDSIKELDKKYQVEIYNAIFEYEFNGIEPNLKGISKSIFTLIMPQLKANNQKYENGKKGGRPKKQMETKQKPNNNQNITEPKRNVNDNVNVNVNDNVNDNYNDNLFAFIESNFSRTLSPIEYEEISNWEDNELTRYAIKQAVLNGKYNIKYISRILDSYKTKNIKTVQQAQEDEEKFKRKKEDSKKTSREKMDEVFERFLNEED